MARRTGLIEDILHIATRLPWWVSIALAIVSYFALMPFATAEIPHATGIKDVGEAVSAQMYKTVAAVFQIMLPALLLLGALISAIRSLFDSRLFERFARAVATPSSKEFHTINWREFERVVGETFRRKGYTVELKGGDQPDGGIDLIVRRHGKRYLVQCKHWSNSKVGVKPVRELYGVVAAQNAAGGFVVTTGRFTTEAHRFAAGQAIYLIDGADLRAVVRELHEESARETPPSKHDSTQQPAPTCPNCASPMVRRTARKGPNAGNDFLGCSRYPICTGSLPLSEHA